jgi:glycine/D-amino acid oxidase-like deaminating enzyme
MSGIVVIGAGIVGASLSYHLARAGQNVILLEQANAPAAGATAASFAWIGDATGEWPGGAQDLRPAVMADWRRLEAEVPGVSVRWTGSLTWRSRGGASEPETALQKDQYWVGRAEMASLEPNLQHIPERAVYTSTDAGVDPLAATSAMLDAARKLGAEVRLGVGPVGLTLTDGVVTGVDSSEAWYPASTVVIAAGIGVNQVCAPLHLQLPIEASPALLVEVAAPAGLVRTILDTPAFEARESRAGHILMTAPDLNADPSHRPLDQLAEGTVQCLRSAFGKAAPIRLLRHQIGWRPMPAEGPIVGYLTPDRRAYVAVMHSGVSLAPTVGRLVTTELVSGTTPDELRRARTEPIWSNHPKSTHC